MICPDSIFRSSNPDVVYKYMFNWMSDFICDNVKIEKTKDGSDRNFDPHTLSGLESIPDLLRCFVSENKSIQYTSYTDFMSFLVSKYLPNKFGSGYIKKLDGYIIDKVSRLVCWLVEDFQSHPFYYTGGSRSLLYDNSYNFDTIDVFFLRLHIYKFISEKTDPEKGKLYSESLKTIQRFLDNKEKKKALIQLLTFRFEKYRLGNNFDSILNSIRPSMKEDFYCTVVKDFITILKTECTAQQVMNFLFVQLITVTSTTSESDSSYISNFKTQSYSRFFWLMTVLFEDVDLSEMSLLITQQIKFDNNISYCDSSQMFLKDVTDFGTNYKNIAACATYQDFNNFLAKEFQESVNKEIRKSSREDLIRLVHNHLFRRDDLYNHLKTNEAYVTAIDCLYGKDSPNKEFLVALKDSVLDTVYYKSFIPVVGTWIDDSYSFRLLRKIFSKKDIRDSIILPQNPEHMKELLKCGFKFGKKPTVDDIYCSYQLPKDWFANNCSIIDNKQHNRALIINKIFDNGNNSKLVPLQSKNYWVRVDFFDRYYISISMTNVTFKIVDRQKLVNVFNSDIQSDCNDSFILMRRAKKKLLEMFPEYERDVTWNLYWD